jgi:DNA mismatch endonuclease (patch repair protein)
VPATNPAFWSEKIARNQRRDREVEITLGKLGWTVLRYWEHEVKDDLLSVVDQIRSAVINARGGDS